MTTIQLRAFEGEVVHQAEGMIVAQANVSVAEAVRLLDEYAQHHGMCKTAVAALVVERHLRFD